MTRTGLIIIATAGSFLLLAGAFMFQALGWAPCKMCLWQRWPHAAAIGIGAFYLIGPNWRFLPILGALAAFGTAGIGIYHSGVERKFWQGPSTCTSSGSLDGLDSMALLPGAAQDTPALVLCDQFTPFFLNLTMANWNALISLGLAVVWLVAWRRV